MGYSQAAYRCDNNEVYIMPGACFTNFTGADASPIRQCFDVSSRRGCFGDSDCVGFSWPPYSLDDDANTEWIAAGCLQGKGRLVPAPASLSYHPGETCGDVIARQGLQTFGACCHERFEGSLPPDSGVACRHYSPEECAQGWIAQPMNFRNNQTNETKRCWIRDAFIESFGSIFVGQTSDPADGCDFLVANIRQSGLSRHLGRTTACRCTSTITPFLPPEWVEAGFSSCVRIAQDPRSWEEACDLDISDGLPCRTRGFPLVIEPDGHAAWYGGHRKVQEVEGGDNGCRHVLAEPYVDDNGFFHSVGCTKFTDEGEPQEMIIGNLGDHQAIRCNAMYTDMGFDDDFVCEN